MSGVQSVSRAFAVLRALSRGPRGVTDLAADVELPKSTVARLLATLEAEGAVTQIEAGGEYALGPALIEISGAERPGRDLVASARPHLQALTEELGETSGISARDGNTVLYLHHVEANNEVEVRDWTGEHAPLHIVPSGLVMLAWASESEIEAYLAQPLDRSTDHTAIDAEVLLERLDNIRRSGYAWVYEEFVEGIDSVAAPIREANGEVVAAIHVHGPSYRFPNPELIHDIGMRVVEAAESLATQLN